MLVLIPGVGSQDFQGLGRYLLGAFPSFALLGAWLAGAGRERIKRVVLVVFPLGLLVGTALFANGQYLS